jgi:hypothetical protein
MVTKAISRKRTGIERRTSTTRIMSESSQPPKNPETAPHNVPKTVATKAESRPTISDACPPNMSRPRMLKPFSSVPSGFPLPGGEFCVEPCSAFWALVWLVG